MDDDFDIVAINIDTLPQDVIQKVIELRKKCPSVYVSCWAWKKGRYSLRTISDRLSYTEQVFREARLLDKGYKLVIGKYKEV